MNYLIQLVVIICTLITWACEPITLVSLNHTPIDVSKNSLHDETAKSSNIHLNQQSTGNPLEYVSFDLFKLAPSGHVQQIGPTLSPNAPGWTQTVAGQKSNIWRKPTQEDQQWVSWIEGRGGSLDFPITENDKSLEYLFIWIKPIASHQVVSIFLDEVLLKNISLKNYGKYYRLRLPKALLPGEHRLRFWFRFIRNAPWGGRTAAAIGPIHFFPVGVKPSHSIRLYDRILLQQRKWGALLAPHPTTWRFYMMLPQYSHFKTHVYVKSGTAVRFDLSVSTDEDGSKLLWSKVVKAGEVIPVKIDLNTYADQPVRLTLQTQLEDTDQKTSESQVAWLDPQIISRHPAPRQLPLIRSVVIWSIAGLRNDLLQYMLAHTEQYPNLARMITQSYILPTVWTQGITERSSYHHFLKPTHATTSFPQILTQYGIRTSLWSASAMFPNELSRLFDYAKVLEPQHKASTIHSLDLIQSLGRELSQNPKRSHFIYLVSQELKLPIHQSSGFEIPELLTYKDSSTIKHTKNYKNYLKQSIVVDYLFAQLLSTLHQNQRLKDTAIILMGSVGQRFKENRELNGIGMPEEVQVPVCIWHPHLKIDTKITHYGGSVGALAATLLESLISSDPLPDYTWPYESLAPFILQDEAMPLKVERSISNGVKITRLGKFFMYERPHQTPILWNLNDPKHSWKNLSQLRPITLRTLRDGISVSDLRDGL
jgi:hypothetical protein